MHWIYYVYIMLCAAQMPFFLVLVTNGHHLRCVTLQPRADLHVQLPPLFNSSSSSSSSSSVDDRKDFAPQWAVFEARIRWLDMEAGVGSALAVVWVVLYMGLGMLDEQHGFLVQCDTTPSDLAEVRRLMDLIRVCFWLLVWYQGLGLIGGICYLHGGDVESHLRWLGVLRIAALFALSRTSPPRDERAPVTLWHVAAVGAYVWWFACVVVDMRQYGGNDAVGGWTLGGLMALDGILMWGHLWEAGVSSQVVLNCRLFYVASASSLLLLSMLLAHPLRSHGGGGLLLTPAAAAPLLLPP